MGIPGPVNEIRRVDKKDYYMSANANY